MVGESIREILEKKLDYHLREADWGPTLEKELKVLNTLKRNIFYKPPPHDVVEVTPVSYALATKLIHC